VHPPGEEESAATAEWKWGGEEGKEGGSRVVMRTPGRRRQEPRTVWRERSAAGKRGRTMTGGSQGAPLAHG